jgi:hypothetical protein
MIWTTRLKRHGGMAQLLRHRQESYKLLEKKPRNAQEARLRQDLKKYLDEHPLRTLGTNL